MELKDNKKAEIRAWLTRQGLDPAVTEIDAATISRFEDDEKKAVPLENYRWGNTLKISDRIRLLKETREALDADPGLAETSAAIPDTITDSDLYLKWLRA